MHKSYEIFQLSFRRLTLEIEEERERINRKSEWKLGENFKLAAFIDFAFASDSCNFICIYIFTEIWKYIYIYL